jgi:hypothetical protein
MLADGVRERLWGSRSRPEPVTCGDSAFHIAGMITDVSMHLLYLISDLLLN